MSSAFLLSCILLLCVYVAPITGQGDSETVFSFNFTGTSNFVFNTTDTCASISLGGVPADKCHERCHLLIYLDFGNHCSGEGGTFLASTFNSKEILVRFFDLLNNFDYVLGYEVAFSSSSIGAGGANQMVDLTKSAIQDIEMRIESFSITNTTFAEVPAMNLTLSLTFNVLGISAPELETFTQNPIADTFVYNGTFSGENYGNSTFLQIDTDFSDENATRVAFLRFELPDYQLINKATLRLYGHHNFTEENVTIPVLISGVDDNSWDESQVTFATAPAIGNEAMLFFSSVGGAAGWNEFDVTPWVRGTYPTGGQSVSFAVTSFITGVAEFSSKEGEQPPELVLLYLASETTERNVPAGSTGSSAGTTTSQTQQPATGDRDHPNSAGSIMHFYSYLFLLAIAMLLL